MVVLCVVCCICIHWCIVFTMHVWGVLCTYGLPYPLPKFQIQILGPPFTLFKTTTGAFHTCPSLTNTYSHLPHWIQPALWLNWLPTLCYWAILHYNTGVYRYYFHYVSGLKFFMIGLNRLIHDLTQALPNMKLKKELCQDPAQGLYYYSCRCNVHCFYSARLHVSVVYISHHQVGIGSHKE